jgi:hypothetical protein
MSSHRERLRALGGSLRKGYPLDDRVSNRQFETLLRKLARIPATSRREER